MNVNDANLWEIFIPSAICRWWTEAAKRDVGGNYLTDFNKILAAIKKAGIFPNGRRES